MRSRSALGLVAVLSAVAMTAGLTGAPAIAASKKAPGAVRITSSAHLKRPATVPGQVIVRYKAGVSTGSRAVVRQRSGGALIEKLSLARTETIKVASGQTVAQTVAQLQSNPQVDLAQPNFRYYPTSTPEPYEGYEWGLNNTGQVPEPNYCATCFGTFDVDINAPEAWALPSGTGSSSVVVGVIDTGIDIYHPDLASAIWTNPGEIPGNGIDDDGNGFVDDVNGWNFYNGTNTVYDGITCASGSAAAGENEDLHGTHVAGTIAAQRNGLGVVGVAAGVKILPLKALGCDGGSTTDVISALEYAKSMGVKIVNMSLGGAGYDQVFKDAIDASGVLVVAAAGNGGSNGVGDNNDLVGSETPEYPASYTSPNIISVASINNVGALSSFSNYGATSVDVGAPGESIISTIPPVSCSSGSGTCYYAWLDGTSMATPHVTGTAALVLSTDISQSASAIKARIMNNTRSLSSLSGKTVTGGLVDAQAAVADVPAVKQPTTLSITRTASTITTGQVVKISTQLLANGSPAAGRTLVLQRYTNGWRNICWPTTNSLGQASCYLYPSTSSDYMWVFSGDPGLQPAWSSHPIVYVRPSIASKLSASTVRRGSSVTFSGSISPSKKGALLRLQRKSGSSWVTMTKTAITSRNTYSFTFKASASGTYSYRAYFYGDSYNAAQASSTRSLKVNP
ncbi:MAG: S8 family peptidase [Actinomycetes bacterium]